MNGDPNKDSDHTIVTENMAVDDSNLIFDCVEVNTVAEENNVHDVCIQETEVQIDIEDSNIDVPNIHGSSKTNDGNNVQTESSVDDDVEQNDLSQKIIQDLQNKIVNNNVGMEMQMRQPMFVEKLSLVIQVRLYLFKVMLNQIMQLYWKVIQ